MANYIVRDDLTSRPATLKPGLNVLRVCFANRKGWNRESVKAAFAPMMAEMIRAAWQPSALTLYWYGQAAAAASYASGDARPFELKDFRFGTAGQAAMGVPVGDWQLRCWVNADGETECYRQVVGGEPHWWLLVWLYWRGPEVTGEWPVVRDPGGNIAGVVDVIAVPRAIAWDPPDKSLWRVAREQIAKAIEYTWNDIPKKPSDLPWWVWWAVAGGVAWYTRPIVAALFKTRGGSR